MTATEAEILARFIDASPEMAIKFATWLSIHNASLVIDEERDAVAIYWGGTWFGGKQFDQALAAFRLDQLNFQKCV